MKTTSTFFILLFCVFYIEFSAQYKITKDINYFFAVQATYNKVAIGKNGLSYVVTTRSPQNTISRYNFEGKLDTTFGVGGIVNIQQDGGKDIFANDNYIYILSNYNVLSKFDMNGQLIPSFGVNGSLDLTLDYQNIYFDDNTPNFYVVSKTQGITKITKYNSVGESDQNFNQLVFPNYVQMAICKDHNFLIISKDPTNNANTELRKYNENGILDVNFGVNGLIVSSFSNRNYSKIFVNSIGEIFVLASNSELFVHKLTPLGFVDTSFGKNGVFSGYDYWANLFVNSFDSANSSILFDSNNNIIMLGKEAYAGNPRTIILRLDKSGNLDRTFHNNSYGFYNEEILSSTSGSYLSKFRLIDDNTFMFVIWYNVGGPWHGAYSPHKYVRKNMLGTKEFESASEFKIYPNPTTDVFYFNNDISKVSVYTMDGKRISVSSGLGKANVSELSSGIYIVTGEDESGKLYKTKLIKN